MPQSLLQPLYPFCHLGRRAFDYYRFIYMYHKPIVKIRIFLKLLPLQGVGLYFINTQGVALG